MATKTKYYNLDKPSYDEVADIEVINANMDKIDQQMRNNADGVNFAKGISSDAYDNSKLYAAGDYCIYDNKLYRCITAIESAEAFNIAKWEQTTVGKEVNQLNSNLDTLEYSEIAGGKNLANINDFKLLTTNPSRYGYEWLSMKGGTYTFNITNGNNMLYIGYKHNGNIEAINNVIDGSKVQTITISDGDDILIWYEENVTTNHVTKIQLEYGTISTEYEPYIPSVKMLSEESERINDSLEDYGLVNVFDGNVTYGYWYNKNDGEYQTSTTSTTITNKISCNGSDIIRVVCPSTTNVSIVFYDSSDTFIIGTDKDGTDVTFTAPPNVSYCRINFYKSGGFGGNIGNVSVYINNDIDSIKNDLGGLSFSASGTTLTITDGNNTWTLTAN